MSKPSAAKPSLPQIQNDVKPFEDGQRYRPYKMFNGSVIPFSLQADPSISPGAKLLFGELAAIRGERDYCHPSLPHLGMRLGVSETKVRRWMGELVKSKLIKNKRRGNGRIVERDFIWNEGILAPSLKSNCANMRSQIKLTAQKRENLTAQICAVEEVQEEEALLSEEVLSARESANDENTAAPKPGAGDYRLPDAPPSTGISCPWSVAERAEFRELFEDVLRAAFPRHRLRKNAEHWAGERVQNGLLDLEGASRFISEFSVERLLLRGSGIEAERYLLGCLMSESHPNKLTAGDVKRLKTA